MRILSFVFVFAALFCLSAALCGCEKDSAPSRAFNEFNESLEKKDWKKVWSMLSSGSRKAFSEEGYKRMREIIEAMPTEIRKKKVEDLGVTNDELYNMSPEAFFVFIMKKTEASQTFLKTPAPVDVGKVVVDGDKAVLYVKGKSEYVNMILEDGKWKVDFEAD